MSQFQPSLQSYGISSTYGTPFGGDYGATWRLRNVFTKKGRAENKQARADYNERKAKEAKPGFWKDWRNRRADKFQMQSSNIKADINGTRVIAPTHENSEKLWAVRYPWAEREPKKWYRLINRTKIMEETAKGYQPASQLINSEYRSSILGAIYILKNAFNADTGAPGFHPYTGMAPESVQVWGKGTRYDKQLIAMAAQGAKAAGKTAPKTLKEASGFLKDEIIERGLARAAWAQRAMLMVGMAANRASVTGMLAGAVLAATATVLTAGAAAPVAAGLLTVGAAGAGVAGQVKTVKLQGIWGLYQLDVENALRKREQQITLAQLDDQMAQADSLQAEIQAAMDARSRAVAIILGGSAAIGASILAYSYMKRPR